jgi:hypothetical protein
VSTDKGGLAKVKNSAKNCQPHQRIFELVYLCQYERYSNDSFTYLPSTSHTIRICDRSKPSSSSSFFDKHLLLSIHVCSFIHSFIHFVPSYLRRRWAVSFATGCAVLLAGTSSFLSRPFVALPPRTIWIIGVVLDELSSVNEFFFRFIYPVANG